MSAVAPAKPNKSALQKEFVAASSWGMVLRQLPQISDQDGCDVRVTPRTYEQIGRDPEAAAALLLLVESVLSDGVQLAPAVDEKDALFQKASDVCDHLERTLCNLERDFTATLKMLIQPAMQFGNKVAEKVYAIPSDGPDANKLVLSRIKVKPRGSLYFIVDQAMNLLGLQPTIGSMREIIAPEKFIIATFRMKDEDPRGTSIFQPIVKPWHVKQLAWPEFLTFLMRCAVPGLIAVLSQQAKDEIRRDNNGDIVMEGDQPAVDSAQNVMLSALLKFKNSTALVVENGTDVKPLEVQSKGEAFNSGFQLCNKEIRKGILLQELATADSQHQTKGSTGEQMTIVDLLVWSIKRWVAEEIIRRQICRPQVEYNFGADAARDLTPKVSLGDFDRRSWATDAVAVETLITAVVLDENGNQRPALTYSQIQALLNQIGIAPPTEEEVAAMRAKAEEDAKLKRQAPQPTPPNQQPGQPQQPNDNGQQDQQKKAA